MALQDLLDRREAIESELASGGITGRWKPNSSIDGESISWDEYRKGLLTELESLNKLIAVRSGPTLIRSRGRSS